MPLDYISNSNKDEYMNMVADSYLYILRNVPYTWKHSWENLCKKQLFYDKLSTSELKILGKNIKKTNICKNLILDKLETISEFSHPINIHEQDIHIDYKNNTMLDFSTFTGVTLDVLIGLLHIRTKHKNVCTTITENFMNNPSLCQYYKKLGIITNTKCEFLNFEIVWVYQKLYTSTDFDIEFEKCLKTSKRFIIVPLGIELREGSHANYIIFDKKLKEVERFEPHGSHYPFGFNYNFYKLDEVLRKKFKFKYIAPKEFLPKISFQIFDSFEKSCIKIGDPKGFCGLWATWYTDMRISYPNIPRKDLALQLINTIKRKNISFKDMIRSYSHTIILMRDSILKKGNIDINDWLNDKYSDEQIQIVLKEIKKQIQKIKKT